MDELIKDLREALYGPAQWGDTVLMSRAIDALTNQQTELAALIEDNDSLRKSLNGESEARCALEDEVKALRKMRLTDAARDVLAERRRQIEQEGWTPEHDDEHRGGQMPMAAASYAVAASYAAAGLYPMPKGKPPTSWPWDKSWWKPGKSRRMLIKAAALILAEIERLDRAALSRSDKS